MLTKRQIRDDVKRRERIIVPYIAFGTIAVIAASVYLLIESQFFPPRPVGQKAILSLLLLGSFFASIFIGLRRANRIQTICPDCQKVLNGKLRRLLQTRKCPECDVKIVEGPEVTEGVLARHRVLIERHQLQFMRYWVWAWPLMSLFIIVAEWWFPGSQRESEAFLWMPGVLGAVSSGWMLMRGKDRSALLPLVVSLVLMGIGGWMFLQ